MNSLSVGNIIQNGKFSVMIASGVPLPPKAGFSNEPNSRFVLKIV